MAQQQFAGSIYSPAAQAAMWNGPAGASASSGSWATFTMILVAGLVVTGLVGLVVWLHRQEMHELNEIRTDLEPQSVLLQYAAPPPASYDAPPASYDYPPPASYDAPPDAYDAPSASYDAPPAPPQDPAASSARRSAPPTHVLSESHSRVLSGNGQNTSADYATFKQRARLPPSASVANPPAARLHSQQ